MGWARCSHFGWRFRRWLYLDGILCPLYGLVCIDLLFISSIKVQFGGDKI